MRTCSVLEFGLEPAAALLNEAFADYFVRITFTPARLLSLVREESVDLEASRVCWDGDRPAAVLLHAARGRQAGWPAWRWWRRHAVMALAARPSRSGSTIAAPADCAACVSK